MIAAHENEEKANQQREHQALHCTGLVLWEWPFDATRLNVLEAGFCMNQLRNCGLPRSCGCGSLVV